MNVISNMILSGLSVSEETRLEYFTNQELKILEKAERILDKHHKYDARSFVDRVIKDAIESSKFESVPGKLRLPGEIAHDVETILGDNFGKYGHDNYTTDIFKINNDIYAKVVYSASFIYIGMEHDLDRLKKLKYASNSSCCITINKFGQFVSTDETQLPNIYASDYKDAVNRIKDVLF